MGRHVIFIGGGDMIAMAVANTKRDMDVLMLVDMEDERQSSSDQAFTVVDKVLCLSLIHFCTYLLPDEMEH